MEPVTNTHNVIPSISNPAGDRNITLREAVEQFLLQCQASGRKNVKDHRTVLVGPGQRVTGKRSAGPALLSTELAHLPVRRLSAQDLRLWFDARHPQWMAASTRKRGMSTLRQLLHFIIANGWAQPTLLTACSKTAASEARRDWLRPEQVPALAQLLKGPEFDDYDRFAIATLFYTGVRAAELVSLRADDLDAQELTLTVRHGKGRGDGKHRYVPVDREFVRVWHDHIRRYGISGRGWMLFRRLPRQVPGPRGTYEYEEDRRAHTTPKPVRARLATLTDLARAQLEPELAPSFVITPHVLRRTFACTHAITIELGLGGIGWLGLKEAMGHTDLQVTTDYLHDVEPYLRRFRRAKGAGEAVRDILEALAESTRTGVGSSRARIDASGSVS